jgi:hypothetical protein
MTQTAPSPNERLSPVLLITLLHFYYTDSPPPFDRERTMEHLIRLQALKLASIAPEKKGWPCAELTPLGNAYVKSILATPLPRPVEGFVDGRTGEFIKP